jgi:hypothetical protein
MLVRDLTVTGYLLSPPQSLHIFAKQALQNFVSCNVSVRLLVLYLCVPRISDRFVEIHIADMDLWGPVG